MNKIAVHFGRIAFQFRTTVIQFPHLYRHAGIPRGIPAHGQPHSIPACRCMRGNTVKRKLIFDFINLNTYIFITTAFL